MPSAIWEFLSTEGFQPHGICLLWRADVFYAHLFADAVVALSYFSIPLAMLTFVWRRPDIEYGWLIHLFGAFIIACGVTHLFGIWTMWVPDYGVEAVLKLATAAISATTAIALWPLMPRLVRAPSPRQLEEKNARLAHEISERRAAEERLRRLNEELERRVEERTARLAEANRALEAARAAAERSNAAKSEFLATMSHEIRTPMNGVLGILDLMRHAPLGPDQSRLVEVGRNSARALLTVINDVLDHSRIEAGSLEITMAPFDPGAMAGEVADLLREGATAKGLGLELDLAPDLPAALVGDGQRLRQILVNLVGNAIRFTEEGEVRLSLTHRRRLDGRTTLAFAVIDTGIGVPAAAHDRIFQRFEQADGETGRRFGGTGLGLAISRHLVELMGGEIGFESEVGRGSRFWFEVPCDSANAVAPRDEPVPPPTLRPLSVLVADDNATSRFLVEQILRQRGHRVTAVASGGAALERLAARRFDLVLMDVEMPDMDGFAATRRLRGSGGPARDVPVVALTAHIGERVRRAGLAAGMSEVLSKPIEPAALLDAVARTARRSERHAGSAA